MPISDSEIKRAIFASVKVAFADDPVPITDGELEAVWKEIGELILTEARKILAPPLPIPAPPIPPMEIPKSVKAFMPPMQQRIVRDGLKGEEAEGFREILMRLERIITEMPHTYQTEGIPTADKIVHLHYFYGDSDWYITEKDKGHEQLQAYGYTILAGDREMAEWGYINIKELKATNKVELDFHWKPKPFKETDIYKKLGLAHIEPSKPVEVPKPPEVPAKPKWSSSQVWSMTKRAGIPVDERNIIVKHYLETGELPFETYPMLKEISETFPPAPELKEIPPEIPLVKVPPIEERVKFLQQLLGLVEQGEAVLLADAEGRLDIPTIHTFAPEKYRKSIEHKGFGLFEGETESGRFNFDAGGAMYKKEINGTIISWSKLHADPAVMIELGYDYSAVAGAYRKWIAKISPEKPKPAEVKSELAKPTPEELAAKMAEGIQAFMAAKKRNPDEVLVTQRPTEADVIGGR